VFSIAKLAEGAYIRDMETIFQGRRIEWDDKKNELNIKNHGFSLETARLVFADPERIEVFDELHSDDEDRYQVIGRIGKVVFVVYTEREDAIRLISARLATAKERRAYYGNS
jgi:uncharacterized DUF497 family protein